MILLSRRGLTLIELLAATVILSMLAAAAVSVQRDASRAAARARLTEQAVDVVERWLGLPTAPHAPPDQREAGDWSGADERGRWWRIRVEAEVEPTDLTDDNPWSLDGPWESIIVETATGPDEAFVEALRLRRSAPPTPSSQSDAIKPAASMNSAGGAS